MASVRTISIVMVLFIVVGCSPGGRESSSKAEPVIDVDDQHSILHSTNATAYRIRPSPSMWIDAGHYTFDMPELIRDKPLTEIWIATDGDTNGPYFYQTAWETGKSRYELSKATLEPADTSPAFDGFKAGQTWTISISAEYETNKSLSAWYGTIEVR
jgi:hypothetical protein